MEDELFQELLESVKQGAAILKGSMSPSRSFEFPDTEVRALRERFGLSQDKFANLVGISVATLRNWEQGRRKPEGPARVLLRIASLHPEVLLDPQISVKEGHGEGESQGMVKERSERYSQKAGGGTRDTETGKVS
jgi:putative transcriptional regulator